MQKPTDWSPYKKYVRRVMRDWTYDNSPKRTSCSQYFLDAWVTISSVDE